MGGFWTLVATMLLCYTIALTGDAINRRWDCQNGVQVACEINAKRY